MIISLGIFSLLALGLIGGAVLARKSSESTIHRALADAVTMGFIEQLRGLEYSSLLAAVIDQRPVTFLVEGGSPFPAELNDPDFTAIKVPLDARSTGAAVRYLDYSFRPLVVVAADDRLLIMEIEYQWHTPLHGDPRTYRMKISRSAIPQA